MKRKILSVAGIFFIFASLFNVSCQNETPTVQDFALDTVLTLDKAEVSATAYPGMNFVSWLPVTNANSYVLYIYVGGNCISSKTYAFDDDLNYVDTNIKNDVEYTYFVEAESSSSTGRAVVTQNSMSEKVTVKAIVPEYNKSALQLVDNETNANKNYIVNSNNLHIARHNNDKLSISLPGKAYLYYDIGLTVDNEYETLRQNNFYECISNPTNNDVTLYTDFTVTQAGTYKANVVVKAINEHFGDSDIITSTESVIVSTLKGSGAIITSAKYKDFGESIRIFFTKFELENGQPAPSSYYKLYRSENGSRNYTLVTNSIKKTDETNNVFYVDDLIEDNTKDYVYTLVITDGNLYTSNPSVKFVDSYTIDSQEDTVINGVNESFAADNILNDILWTIQLPSDDAKITEIYSLEKSVDESSTVVTNDFYQNGSPVVTNLTSPNDETEKTFTITTHNHPLNSKVYLLVRTEKENKAVGEYISAPVIRNTTVRTVNFFDENGNRISTHNGYDYITLKEDNSSDWNKVPLPSIPQKDCYRGYWRHENGEIYENIDSIYLLDEINNFYIEYELIKINVYFVNELYNNIVDPIIVEKEINGSDWNTIILPPIPQKEGYISDGYWYNIDNDFDSTKESYSKTLYKPYTYLTPKYMEVRTAYFKGEDGIQLVEPISVTEDISNSNWNRFYLPSIPNKEGYVSDGYWYDSYGNSYYQNTYVILYDTTTNFTAKYRELYIRTSNFLDEDGTQIADSISVTEDIYNSNWNKIYLPSIPAKDGYTNIFNKWYDNEGNSYSPNSYYNLIATTTNFVAKYVSKTITTMDQYYIGNITSNEQTQYHYLNCTAGDSYTVSWLDSFDGSSELSELLTTEGLSGTNVDVKVSIYSYDGSQQVISNQDNGFEQPVTFTANETNVFVIEVIPFDSNSAGYYAVKVN